MVTFKYLQSSNSIQELLICLHKPKAVKNILNIILEYFGQYLLPNYLREIKNFSFL